MGVSKAIRAALMIATCAAIGLSGCASKPQGVAPPSSQEAIVWDTPTLLKQVRQALMLGEFGNAEQQLQQLLERELSANEQLEFLLLTTDFHLLQHNTQFVGDYLIAIDENLMVANDEQELRAAVLKARWYEATGEHLAAARQRDFLSHGLRGDEYLQNHERIWHNLTLIPEDELMSWAANAPYTQFGQWLKLAAIARDTRSTLDEQVKAVNDWRQANKGHPAEQNLPGGLAMLNDLANSRPERAALLLPLSGPLEKTGSAVRDGFMAAYYDSLNKGYPVPQVFVYDSTEFPDMAAAYAQAQFDQAQWVIGPIDKTQVQTLQQRSRLPLPTLALNYGDRADNERTPNNLYQYGLAAEDEALQIAERAWLDGKRRALALVPQGQWGQRIYNAFEERWQALGGIIVEQHAYPNRQDYNPDVRALLNVDDSQKRYQTIRRLITGATEFEPRRREDADWIFMVALPQQARQIKPTLAFNFAADLPVYATSHLYAGEPNARRDRDLNGIKFCDIPWVLRQDELYKTVEQSVGTQGNYARLYALGVDAFRLLPRLKQLEAFPNSQVFGSTGGLMLDEERRIVRRSDCTEFENGRPRRLAAN